MSMYGKHPTKWDGNKWLDPPMVDCSGDKVRTVQANASEVDINKIVARVQKGLSVPMLAGEPFYGDVSNLGGLQEAMMKVQEAEDLFMQYPANVRERFSNNPIMMVDFLADEKNRAEAIELGLVQKPIEKPAEPAK